MPNDIKVQPFRWWEIFLILEGVFVFAGLFAWYAGIPWFVFLKCYGVVVAAMLTLWGWQYTRK